MARPIIGKKKDVNLKTRIDSDMNEKLLEYCEKNNVKRTDVVRVLLDGLLNKKVGD